MKHFLLLAFVIIVCYIGWQITDKRTRQVASRRIMPHVFRLVSILLLAFALLLLATQFSATPLF